MLVGFGFDSDTYKSYADEVIASDESFDCTTFDHCYSKRASCELVNMTAFRIDIAGQYTYDLPVKTWCLDGWENGDGGDGCQLLVYGHEDSENGSSISLGQTFLKQLTLAFNVDTKSIQVAPSKLSDPGVTVSSTDPDPDPPEPVVPGGGGDDGGIHWLWIIVLVIILMILCCCLIFLLLWFIRKKNREEGDDGPDSSRDQLQEKYGSLLQSQADTEESKEEEKIEGNDNMLGPLKNEGNIISTKTSLNFENGMQGRPI